MMLWLLLVAAVDGSLVSLEQGVVEGVRADDGDYTMYMGIPYAEVDKENPFGVAIPNPKFDGILLANDDTAKCPQMEQLTKNITGTLDCLHLNIYVPSSSSKLAVMVWIHGGSMVHGSAGRFVYGPQFLVRHNIILVTLNYRLGPYGFMCLGTDKIPGNQGLKDQVLAMRWVRDNIAAFGGDVDNITLFGESAGARSTEFHLLSNNENLFNRAIMQSGATVRYGFITSPSDEVPFQLANYLGSNFSDLEEAIDFLAKRDPKDVLQAFHALSMSALVCFEDANNKESIVTFPVNHNNEKIRTTPIMSGYNDHEMLMSHVQKTTEDFQSFDVFFETMKIFNLDNLDRTSRIMRRFYIGDEMMSDKVRWEIIDFDSDLTYAYPVQRSIDMILKHSEVDVYHYIFSYSGDRNYVKSRANVTEGGAAHADDLGYLFDVSFFDSNPNEEDRLILDRMTTMWTNFAKYGDPTPSRTELLPEPWHPATRDTLHCLHIDTEMSSSVRPNHAPHAMWDLFYKYLLG